MMRFVETFIITLALFLVLDWVWFMNVASTLYSDAYSGLLRTPDELFGNSILIQYLLPVIFVYILMALGITLLAIPASNHTSLGYIAIGALFGLVLYGVYNFIAFSFFKGFSLHIAIIDTTWGTFSCALITLIAGNFKHRA